MILTFVGKYGDTDPTKLTSIKTQYKGLDLEYHFNAIRLYNKQQVDYQRDHILMTALGLTTKNTTYTASLNVPFNQHCEDYIDDMKNVSLSISKLLLHALITNMGVYHDEIQIIYIDTIIAQFEKFAKDDPSYIVDFSIQMWT